MPLANSTRLGPYEIVAPIGAGGMGEVYRAHDSKLGRDVALKVVPDVFARDADRMARFEREAKVLASLNHPNIASIYGLEDSGSTRALVMELVEGPTLADRIRTGPIPLDEILPIAKQIAEAVEYAHERGIVHRDLKPANVKVTAQDNVKVLDFGLAKALEGDAASVDIATSPTMSRMATMAGILLGTAAYMSPEQAKAKPVDRRADIWAFGCVLYEMLTGKSAFSGETVTDTLAAVIKEEPDWSLLPAATPIRLRVLLHRCLQKDPRQRLRDIGDARIAIDEILSGVPLDSGPSAAAKPSHPWLAWSVAAAFLVAFAALAFVHFRQAPPAPAEVTAFQIPVPDKVNLSSNGTFALSPDGRKLAYAAAGPDGVQRLWVRDLGSLESRPLPGSESPTYPPFFWSPDNRFIAYDAGGKLAKIDSAGGPAQTVCPIDGNAVGGSWNRDGVIIFAGAPGSVRMVSAEGGPSSPVVALDAAGGETSQVFPSFLPDGRHFVYTRVFNIQAKDGVYLGSLDAKPEAQDSKPLIEGDFNVVYVPSSVPNSGYLLFERDGVLLAQPFDAGRLQLTGEPIPVADHVGSGGFSYFSASNNGVLVYRTGGEEQGMKLTWFDRQGKTVGASGELGAYITAVLSPDGRRAAISQFGEDTLSLSLLDFSQGRTMRFTFGQPAIGPVWSPDGTRIIYLAGDTLYQKPSNGSTDQETVLKSSAHYMPTSWSRDGRFLLATAATPETKSDIWILPLMGEKKPVPFLRTEFNESEAHFSPDEHWVAYTSDESGHQEIYVRPFSPGSGAADVGSASGGKWLISLGGGSEPRWRGDGKELFYVAPNGKLMAVEVTANPVFQAGAPAELFAAPARMGPSILPRWDVAPDGKRFLFAALSQQTASTPFTVILNWQSTLKK
jgi:eukaryotic-like serine/threonine-protein kinase